MTLSVPLAFGPNLKIRVACLLVLVATVACDEPFVYEWTASPLVATLYSLDRDELSRPSAFHMARDQAVVIEDPLAGGQWDFALDRQGGQLVLLPPRALGVTTRAGIAVLEDMEYADVLIAPSDSTAYSTLAPVVVEDGNIYVIRTHVQPNSFGQSCRFYGKIDPLEVDIVNGVLRFLHETSPDCNNRRLVPP